MKYKLKADVDMRSSKGELYRAPKDSLVELSWEDTAVGRIFQISVFNQGKRFTCQRMGNRS